MVAFVFGLIGLAALRYGKREGAIRPIVLGLALMVYPYFFEELWALLAVGVGLTTALFVFRE